MVSCSSDIHFETLSKSVFSSSISLFLGTSLCEKLTTPYLNIFHVFILFLDCGENPEIEARRLAKEEKKRLRLEKEAAALQSDIDAKIGREKVALWRKIERMIKKNDEVCDE